MNILGIFRSIATPTPVDKPPSYAALEISESAKIFLKNLVSVRKTVVRKENQVLRLYFKTEDSAKEVAKNAAEGNVTATIKNFRKLQRRSDKLFAEIESPLTKDAISAAKAESRYINLTLLSSNLRLR